MQGVGPFLMERNSFYMNLPCYMLKYTLECRTIIFTGTTPKKKNLHVILSLAVRDIFWSYFRSKEVPEITFENYIFKNNNTCSVPTRYPPTRLRQRVRPTDLLLYNTGQSSQFTFARAGVRDTCISTNSDDHVWLKGLKRVALLWRDLHYSRAAVSQVVGLEDHQDYREPRLTLIGPRWPCLWDQFPEHVNMQH